jgi:hypothetical protein
MSKERFILAHGSGGFSPWALWTNAMGLIAFGPVGKQHIMVGALGGAKSHSPYDGEVKN